MMDKPILSKEEERILLNGRIEAIRDTLKAIPKWRKRLYAKNATYQAREFHLQNVIRNKSTNPDLTALLEEIVAEYLAETEATEARKKEIYKRARIKF